jgi:hypothetical protein
MDVCLPPVSSSWWQSPWDSRPEYIFNWTLAVIVFMSFTIAGPRQYSHSKVWVPLETHDHILLSQIRDSPKPGCPGLRIHIPQALGSLSVAFYDSQGYGGGNRPCLLDTDHIENTVFVLLCVRYHGNMCIEPLCRNGLHKPILPFLWTLPSNGLYLHSHRLATCVYATIL